MYIHVHVATVHVHVYTTPLLKQVKSYKNEKGSDFGAGDAVNMTTRVYHSKCPDNQGSDKLDVRNCIHMCTVYDNSMGWLSHQFQKYTHVKL